MRNKSLDLERNRFLFDGWFYFFDTISGGPSTHFFKGVHHTATSLIALARHHGFTIGSDKLKAIPTLLISRNYVVCLFFHITKLMVIAPFSIRSFQALVFSLGAGLAIGLKRCYTRGVL